MKSSCIFKMDTLAEWVSGLDEAGLRILVARCLSSGAMCVERASVQLQRIRFDAACARYPWRTCASLQSTLCALPSATLGEFLSAADCLHMCSLSTLIANHLEVVPLLRACCAANGITVPQTFTDAAALQVLYRFAQAAPGVPWTLACEADVREVIRVSKLAIQGWTPPDGVFRCISFAM